MSGLGSSPCPVAQWPPPRSEDGRSRRRVRRRRGRRGLEGAGRARIPEVVLPYAVAFAAFSGITGCGASIVQIPRPKSPFARATFSRSP
jgi:hypothetical protein